MRKDSRQNDMHREIKITRDYIKYPQGSALCEFGDTKVICTAFVEEKVPPFLKGTGKGWVSAEYSMLPAANATRKQRDISRLKLDGRSAEIQRLIGRSLRCAVDTKKLGERTIWVDCDVIQADGGSRTASITGGFVAMYDAVNYLMQRGLISENPIKNFIGAVSVGIVDDECILDLCYEEDSRAQCDMNVVMTDEGDFVELQATAEGRSVKEYEMDSLIMLATQGIMDIIEIQKKVLGI